MKSKTILFAFWASVESFLNDWCLESNQKLHWSNLKTNYFALPSALYACIVISVKAKWSLPVYFYK